MKRRQFLRTGATLGGSLALPHSLMAEPTSKLIRGNAEHVISIWLGGGMAQTDTFDPKRVGESEQGRLLLSVHRHGGPRRARV
jgi:hypothetical protein